MDVPAAGAALLFVVLLVGAVIGPPRLARMVRRVARPVTRPIMRRVVALARRRKERAPAPPRPGRPIEVIARDARRLGLRFHYLPPGVSFARFEGGRKAYDDVLAEACLALGVEHLLGVLPPGPELDTERGRVEVALEWTGLRLDLTP
jgi:hypothetical protein